MREKNFYKVIAKCGHVGRNKYIPIAFVIEADNGREAASIVRVFPRVKHDHKDAILFVKQIDYDEYLEIKKINNNDPYLRCNSSSEQKRIKNINERSVTDTLFQKQRYDKQERIERVHHKLYKYKLLLKTIVDGDHYDYVH